MKIATRVEEFIRRQQLMTEGNGALVALSGGADSVALLRILLQLGYRCRAVHCNFHLRGEESNRDEAFATELCKNLGVACEVVHFDTLTYAAEHHLSVEMAARELRYEVFEQMRKAHHLDVIAVAHHQDDAVETLLLNLVRGTGINGLTGIRARNGHVVRPLLRLTRDEIIAYLKRLEQPYVTDSTNLTDEYARNKVRLNLLPLMEQINPAARANIAQTAMYLSEAATLYNKVVTDAVANTMTPHEEGADINIAELLKADAAQTILFEALRPYGFNSAQVADIYRALNAEAGALFEAADYIVLRDRTHLLIRRKHPVEPTDDIPLTLPNEGIMPLPDGKHLRIWRIVPDDTWQVPRQSNVLCLDAECIGQPLTLRHPHTGDRFKPFGMKGYKLLSDFYNDIKLPRTEKPHQWLLCHGDDIVWAVGKRSSELYRLDSKPGEVICIEVLT